MACYDIEGNVISDMSITVADVVKPELRENVWLKQIATESDGVVQGACTDGSYIYYVCTGANKLKKYNLQTGEVTSVSYTSGLYGHGNDMTYNPNTNKLYITVMDEGGHIAIVNPSTLEQESQFVLYGAGGAVQETHGIAFDRIHNQFITADVHSLGCNYSVFDSGFNYVKTIVTERQENYTLQGIETDGICIYRALWDSPNTTNYTAVYDLQGNFIKIMNVGITYELEAIANDWNGNWYMNAYTNLGGKLYACGLFNTTPFESLARLMS